MKPPDKIKVGPHTYTVHFDVDKANSKSHEHGCHVNGHVDLDELEVIIRPTLSYQRRQECLVHEWLHTIMGTAKILQDDAEQEEELVDRMAPVVLQSIKDNIKLFEYFESEEND